MSYIRVSPGGQVLTYYANTLVAEAAASNAQAQVSIVVPAQGPPLHVDAIVVGYQGGAASQSFAVAGTPLGASASVTVNTTITNTPAAITWLGTPGSLEFAANQTVTFTLPAGGASIIGYVSVLYRIAVN